MPFRDCHRSLEIVAEDKVKCTVASLFFSRVAALDGGEVGMRHPANVRRGDEFKGAGRELSRTLPNCTAPRSGSPHKWSFRT